MFAKLSVFGRGRSLQYAITFACSMAFILFGYDQGVFGGIVINENWQDTFDNPQPGLEGIIVSIYNLGAFSGCVLSFFTGERLGRRMSMWFAMSWIVSPRIRMSMQALRHIQIVGAILQTTASSVPHLMIGRYVTGIGTGLETSTGTA